MLLNGGLIIMGIVIYIVMMNKMEYVLQDIHKLLSFCIYEMYEKQDKDFDWKFYLEYIRDSLNDLIRNSH